MIPARQVLHCKKKYGGLAMEFHNKTVIITGASVGIGKATAIEFARNGANVCIVDVNAEGLIHLPRKSN